MQINELELDGCFIISGPSFPEEDAEADRLLDDHLRLRRNVLTPSRGTER